MKDWEVKKLGDLCEIRTGKVDVNSGNPNGDYPFFTCARDHTFSDIFAFDCEAILIAGNGEVGLSNYYNGKFQAYQRTYVLSSFHSITGRYFKYVIDSELIPHLKRQTHGAAIPYIKKGGLTSCPIPVPPLAEQKAIVKVLDKAFAAIDQAKANIQQNITNAKELFQSKLNQIFSQKGEGWVEKTLPEAASEFGRGKSKHRPRNAEFLYGGPYPFVQTGDVRNCDHTITSYTQTYSEEGLAQSKLWPAGTICITIAANIAETGILGFEGCFPDSVIGMIPDPAFTSSAYVEYLLRFFKVELQAVGKGAAQDNINLGTFKNRNFPFAPFAEQEKIIQQLNDLSKTTTHLESHYKTKLASLDELKKSILQKAFAGELT